MLTIYTSTMSHELLTPLRCVNQVAHLAKKKKDVSLEVQMDLDLIINAANLLVNQVKGSLDK
jgi:hypothetical protein